MNLPNFYLALDGMELGEALYLAGVLHDRITTVKLHSLYDRYGPIAIQTFRAINCATWVDYKCKDTPDTVGYRVEGLAQNGARFVTVHASGGVEMMKRAVLISGAYPIDIWAITVLTSLSDQEIARIHGKDRTREQIVHEHALMAHEAGIKTVICSAKEVGVLSMSAELEGMRFIVPGTRSAGVALGQQVRSGTPRQAVEDGASGLVIGSQVTKAADPVAAFEAIVAEIQGA